jgi:hypothetical protein
MCPCGKLDARKTSEGYNKRGVIAGRDDQEGFVQPPSASRTFRD